MEVVRVSLFFKQKLMMVMIDVSMACAVSKFSHTDTPEQDTGLCLNTVLTVILFILPQIQVILMVPGCCGKCPEL